MERNANSISPSNVLLLEKLSTLPNVIVLGTDFEGYISFVNRAAKNILGPGEKKLLSKPIEEIIDLVPDWKTSADKHGYSNFNVELPIEIPLKVNAQGLLFPANVTPSINFLIIIDPFESKEPIDVSFDVKSEHVSIIKALNEIIGVTNYLRKNSTDTRILKSLKVIYDKAWEVKERLQGSIKELEKKLPEGYDLIDFNELFTTVRDFKRWNIDKGVITLKTKFDPIVFFSHPQRLQSLFTGITYHFVEHAETLPITVSFQVIESDTGITINIMSGPVDMEKEGFLNEKLLIPLNSLNGELTVSRKDKKGVDLKLDIPHPEL